MTPEEIAYVAGLLEGEGCFDRNNRNNPRRRCYPRIRMETKDRDTAERLQAIVGSGSVLFRQAKKLTHSDTYMFTINRSKEAVALMRVIYPWMSERRKQRIDEILILYDRDTESWV